MVREIYIHSGSEIAFHNFTVYLTKIMVEGRRANVKVMELLDFPRDDLNLFCTQKIGVSPFSKRPAEVKLIEGLIKEYAFTIMEGSDPVWWVRKATEQTERLISEFPNVLVAMGGIDKNSYLNFLKAADKTLMGLKQGKDELPLAGELSNNPTLSLNQDFKLSSPDEIDKGEIDKTESFLQEIGVLSC